MKSVTLLSVLLVAAAVASAELRVVVDPPVNIVGRDSQPGKAYLVRLVNDTGLKAEDATSVDIQFTGTMMQAWAYNMDAEDFLPTPGGLATDKPTNPTNWKDSRFIPNVAVVKAGTEAENLLTSGIFGLYMAGTGDWLGAWYDADLGGPIAPVKKGMSYGFEGGVPAVEVALIVIPDTNTAGVRMFGNIAKFGNPNAGIDVDMMIGAIPEPASISLLALGGIAALIRRRRA